MHLLKIGPQQVVYHDKHQRIYRITADFGSFTKEYFVRDSGSRAGVVVVQGDRILLVRQYRLLINRVSWEIPGGKVDEGETPQASAIRECLEETGVFCRSITPLLSYHPGLDALYNPTHLFYSDDHVRQSRSSHDPQEVIQHEWVPLARCIDMIFAQQIVDSFSIVALLSYRALLDRR